MKFLILQERYDCGNTWTESFDKCPIKEAQQEPIVVIEKNYCAPVKHIYGEVETITHEGKTFKHLPVEDYTNPAIEGWLEEGYDHTFEDEPQKRIYYQEPVIEMTRKVEEIHWVIEINTLEELLAVGEFNLRFGHEFNLEDKNMPVIVL